MGDPVAELRSAVAAAADALRDGAQAGASAPALERPPKPEFGDYSTNAAMLLAPALGEPPRGTAEKLADELGRTLEDSLEKVEVAGPDFSTCFSRTPGTGAPPPSSSPRASGWAGRPARTPRASVSTSSSSRRIRPAR